MTKIVLLDAQLSIANNNLTSYTAKIELSEKFELGITFKQSYTTAELDAIMWALRRSVVTFSGRADDAAVGVSNPQYQGSILINKWVPISGSVGDVAEVDVTFPGSGPLARVTST